MTADVTPPYRRKPSPLPAFFGFGLLGALPLWFALSGLIPALRAIAAHAPLVAISPRDSIGLPIALLCFTLAAMTLLPAQDGRPGHVRRARAEPKRALNLCLAAAAASVLLTIVAVPLTTIAASEILAERHYIACPAPLHERHPPLRWTLAKSNCP